MDFFNRPLQLLNTFFSTLGMQSVPGSNEVTDYQSSLPGYEFQRPVRGSSVEDAVPLDTFQSPVDIPIVDYAWKNAELRNDAGDRIGFIEDMVARRDRSDAGFLIKLTGPESASMPIDVFVSVDDIEASGSHFVCKMPPDFGGLGSIDHRKFVSLTHPPTII